MPALLSRNLSPLLERHKPVPADPAMETSSLTALPYHRGTALLALTACASPKLLCVSVKNSQTCREDTEVQGTRKRRSPMDGGSHSIHKEPFQSSADGKVSAHVLVAQRLFNSSLQLTGRQEVTSVIAFLCMTPSKTFCIR